MYSSFILVIEKGIVIQFSSSKCIVITLKHAWCDYESAYTHMCCLHVLLQCLLCVNLVFTLSIPHFQKGFCHALDGLTDLGLLDDKPLPCLEVGAPPLKWVSDITCVFSGYDICV